MNACISNQYHPCSQSHSHSSNVSFILTESSKKSTKVFTDNALVNGLLVGAGAGLLGSLVVGKIINDQQQKCVYRYKRDGTGSARSV